MEGRPDGSQQVVLDTGTRYEGTALLRDFRITDFVNYEAVIGHQAVVLNPSNADQAPMQALWDSNEKTSAPSSTGVSRWYSLSLSWR